MSGTVLTSSDSDAGLRLDSFLAAKDQSHSRSVWQKQIQNGHVLVNDQPVKNVAYKVKVSDKIKIQLHSDKSTPVKWKLPILEETDDWLVVDKPSGLLTHAKGELLNEETVASKLADKVVQDGSSRAGIVHRLDRDTSGVMIVAKNQTSLKTLQSLFSQRRVHKVYQAIVSGRVADKQARLTWPIERDPKNPARFRVGRNGKPAETKLTTVKLAKRASWVELEPLTGRTHQLRVHMRVYGHPILGDRIYASDHSQTEEKRLFLHAAKLGFQLNGQSYEFTSPVPESFQTIMDKYDQ